MRTPPWHLSTGFLAWPHGIPNKDVDGRVVGTSPAMTTRRVPLSAHAELPLQAGRGGRVLEHQLLVREHVMIGLLRHQRRLVEAAQDELALPRVPIDVADGEDPVLVGLEAFGVDRDERAVAQLDAPLRHRSEL